MYTTLILSLFFFFFFFFFFQAEDGIRDRDVTGVQTCALPICARHCTWRKDIPRANRRNRSDWRGRQIGRASWGKSVDLGGRRIIKKKKQIKRKSLKTNTIEEEVTSSTVYAYDTDIITTTLDHI